VLRPITLVPEDHPKAWGGEMWLCNNEEFCGKRLTIHKGARFSMHFHAKKREVFWVLKGEIHLSWVDPSDAAKISRRMKAGECVEIPRLLPHQITAIEDAEVVEFSTHHDEADSYRVAPGDSQVVLQ